VVNSVGMRLALVPAGRFRMGSPETEEDRFADEGPRHDVEISRPFFLGVHPVTQAEYLRLLDTNLSFFGSPRSLPLLAGLSVKNQTLDAHPVEMVSWYDALVFCQTLSRLPEEQQHGRVYRLPTEAEWEYACRGSTASEVPFAWGATLSSFEANFDGSQPAGAARIGPSLRRTTPVGAYRPNAWGLYDLHGNVCEWCNDWYTEYYYRQSPVSDPQGPEYGAGRLVGQRRVLRGGAWNGFGSSCRAAFRYRERPEHRSASVGFRVVMELARGPAGDISPGLQLV
jgi:formylglycine-generating enzyme required for sulfatase activity